MNTEHEYQGVKRTSKDCVFTHMFSIPEYQLELYKALPDADESVTVENLKTITIENILTDAIYNDLGFMVKDNLVVLVEAQSTWSPNILVRLLLYVSETYRRLFEEQNSNLYGTAKIDMPRVNLFVIYTGNGHLEKHGQTINLTDEFFGGIPCAINTTATILCKTTGKDIISQYIRFCKIVTEQTKQLGRTRDAIKRTIEICKEKDILSDYLQSREKEVIDMMEALFNEERILASYMAQQKKEAMEQGIQQGVEQTEVSLTKIVNAFLRTQSIKYAADAAGVSVEKVKEILDKCGIPSNNS